MATNDVVINGLIKFEVGDTELEKVLGFLYKNGSLQMDCGWCGTTIIPQCRAYQANTGKTEFDVKCINCGRSIKVRMYGSYGFVLPTDDEFYKGSPRKDGWEA